MFQSRRLCLSTLGVVAWSTTAADAVFHVLDAASLSAAGVSFAGLLIASSALDAVSFVCVGIFSVQYAWKRGGITKHSILGRRILASSCICVCALAVVVSIVSLIMIKERSKEIDDATKSASTRSWAPPLGVQFAIWALACISQLVLFSSLLWLKPAEKPTSQIGLSAPRDSVMSEIRNSNQTASLHIMEPTMPSSPLAALPSPTFSAKSSQSLKSWRDSLQSVVRPVTSKTRLINRPSSNRDTHSVYSEGTFDTVSQTDGFETWDTSSVDPQTRDAVMQSQTIPSRGTALETIPGSRPASPARALDGPFPESDGRSSPALVAPPKLIPDTSRPPSPAVSEAHIHPLFRTESPVPPPEATPGTSILASPLSGQVITCPPRPYSRMRSNSTRATSPTPLMHSQSFQSLHERAVSPREKSRSPSPPSRQMTPPIPDFVLNPSPRNSVSGTRNVRKVSPRIDGDR